MPHPPSHFIDNPNKGMRIKPPKSRTFSTAVSPSTKPSRPYPFSTKVVARPLPPTFVPNDNRTLTKRTLSHPFTPPTLTSLRKGVGLLAHLHRTLPLPSSHPLLSTSFARRGRGRLLPGTVLTLTLSQPPYTFSGVLLSIRRTGPDSSILLRNVVRKTGVEMRVSLASPTLKAIKVVQRAERPPPKSSPRKKPAPKARKSDNEKEKRKLGPKPSTTRTTTTTTTAKNGDKPQRLSSENATTKTSVWTLNTPGPRPTIRQAREMGILPTVPRTTTPAQTEGAVPVDETDTLYAKRARRARLYFLRDYPSKMSAIRAGINKRDQ